MPRPLTSCKWCGAGSAKFLRDDSTGQTVCGVCYTVLAVFREDMTENGEAPVFQEDDQGKQRTGGPTDPFFDDMMLQTVGPGFQGGMMMDGSAKIAQDTRERQIGFTIIEEQGRNLGLSVPVILLAKTHYREIHKRKTIIHNQVVEDADTEDALEREKRERFKRECVDINRYSQPTIVTACVFLAIRREKTTHTLKEILGAAKKWSVARKELNRAYGHVRTILNIQICNTNAADAVDHWAQRLKLPEETRDAAEEIARNCCKVFIRTQTTTTMSFSEWKEVEHLREFHLVSEIQPSANAAGAAAAIAYKVTETKIRGLADGVTATTAGGAIYVACYISADPAAHRTLKQISDETGAAEVTIRSQVKLLVNNLDKVLPVLYGDEARKEQLIKEFRVSKNIAQETKSYDPSLVGRIQLLSAPAAGGAAAAEGGSGSMQPPEKRVKVEQ